MRAVVMEGIGRLEVREVPEPESAPGVVVLRTVAVGICGSDIHGYAGETGRRVPGQVMGHEAVGTIEAVDPADGPGLEAAGFGLGATVTFNPLVGCATCTACAQERPQHCAEKHVIGSDAGHRGALAEFVSVPVVNLVPLPPGTPAVLGALVEPLAVAVHAVRRAGVKLGDEVVVIGGGPIGQCIVLAALDAGASRVRVGELQPARTAVMLSLGADELGDAAPEPVADVAIDAVGLAVTLAAACAWTRSGGTVCLAGMASPTLSIDAYLVSFDERSIVGTFCYTPQDFRAAAGLLGRRVREAALLVSETIGLDDLPSRMSRLAGGDVPPGKVLVTA